MLTFFIPRLAADRLARMGLACDETNGPIGHIGLRVTPTALRFATTNGRILASLLIPIEHIDGDPADVILDREQFTAAMKNLAKAAGGSITAVIGPKEARFSRGIASAIVRRIDGTFPQIEHVWTRPAGRRWVPTMSSLDPTLVTIAQKISGNKQSLLFTSPVDPSARLERLWSVVGPDDHAESVGISAMRAAVTAPAYWCDHELVFLIMPISRASEERQLDLSEHALSLPSLVSSAA